MRKLLIRLLVIAFPALAFLCLLEAVVLPLYARGDTWGALAYAFAGVLVLAVWEGLAFRCWLLPLFGKAVSSAVYGGGYTAQADPVLAMAARIRAARDASLLPAMIALVHDDAARARGWTELASLYEEVFHNLQDALQCLTDGAQHASSREERAMLLYRAARFRRARMADSIGADELLRRLAKLYPDTVYGRKAAGEIA